MVTVTRHGPMVCDAWKNKTIRHCLYMEKMNKDGETTSRKRQRTPHDGGFFVESPDGNWVGLRSRERNHPPLRISIDIPDIPRMRCRMRCAHPPPRNHVNHVNYVNYVQFAGNSTSRTLPLSRPVFWGQVSENSFNSQIKKSDEPGKTKNTTHFIFHRECPSLLTICLFQRQNPFLGKISVPKRWICHVATSCDYRERFISDNLFTKLIETTNES